MIEFRGSGDDVVVVKGCNGDGEFYTYEPEPFMWRGDLIAPDGGQLCVFAVLLDGTWGLGLKQVLDTVPMPAWPVAITQHRPPGGNSADSIGYSAVLRVDAPPGTRLTNIWPTGAAQ